MTVDVTDAAQVGAMVEAAVAEFGAVDILVNAAGVGTLSTLVDSLDEEWDMVLGVNLKGTARPLLLAARTGDEVAHGGSASSGRRAGG